MTNVITTHPRRSIAVLACTACATVGIALGVSSGNAETPAPAPAAPDLKQQSAELLTRFVQQTDGSMEKTDSASFKAGTVTFGRRIKSVGDEVNAAGSESLCVSVAMAGGGGNASCRNVPAGSPGVEKPFITAALNAGGSITLSGLLPAGATNAALVSPDGRVSQPVPVTANALVLEAVPGTIGTLTYRDAKGQDASTELESLAKNVLQDPREGAK